MVISSTFMGGSLANGACPCASSNMVMPKDQMSASELYLQRRERRRCRRAALHARECWPPISR